MPQLVRRGDEQGKDKPPNGGGRGAQPINPSGESPKGLVERFKDWQNNAMNEYNRITGQLPMRFDAYGRETPIGELSQRDEQAMQAVQGGGLVRPSQVVKAMRAEPYTLRDRIRPLARQIFGNRKNLRQEWADVGGKGPTDVEYKGRGAEMTAFQVKPRSGEQTEILKMPHRRPDEFELDPDLAAQPFMVPSKSGGGRGAPYAWVAQPEVEWTENVIKKTPAELGFDPKDAVRKMLGQVDQSPYYFHDRWPFNIGFLNKEAKVLDVGSVSPRYPGQTNPSTPMERQIRALLKPEDRVMGSTPGATPDPMGRTPTPPTRSQMARELQQALDSLRERQGSALETPPSQQTPSRTPSSVPWWMQR